MPHEAADQLILRRQARRSLLHFTSHTYSAYRADPAHALIAEHLERVERGELKRLMVFAPPQHGKTELTSIRFVAWHLAKHPEAPIILTSYAAALAEAKSWEARTVVESPAYRLLFPGIETDPSSRARNYWRLAGHRGQVVAAGVGGPITGHGSKLGIIDDPIENCQQAQSYTTRETVWQWYRSTFRTRIWEDGAIVLIQTRWHQDDLAGRLLQEQGDRWTVLRLPALAETQAERDEHNRKMGQPAGLPEPLGRQEGEPLCPTRFSRETLEGTKRDIGSVIWTAMYQGAPTPPEGGRIKRAWLPIVDAVPAEASRIRYWDKAASIDGKRTAGVKMASAGGIFYIEHVVCGQWLTGERRAVTRQAAEMDGKHVSIWIEQEPGSSGVDSVQDEIKMLAGWPVFADKVTGDKDTRLEPFAAQAEAGNVKLLRGDWNQMYIDELSAVPNSQYRDQADATAGAFNRLSSGVSWLVY